MTATLVAVVAIAALLIQHFAHRRAQAHTASLLERISTEPRIELRPAPVPPVVDPKVPKYISDEHYMDEAWNDYRGVKPEDDE